MISRTHPDLDTQRENERLFALHSTRLLDRAAAEGFDRITRLAAELFGVPIALISLVDRDRQWFQACIGLDTAETPREQAFCDYTIRHAAVTVVEDATKDARFAGNPLVTGEPGIRFYAGAPLILRSGHALGSLCLIDRVPRKFSVDQCERLKDLAAVVMSQIDLHRAAGRIDELTQLPNHVQMLEDLHDLSARFPGNPRTLLLVEAIDHGAVRDAVRAVGVGPVEDFLRALAIQLQSLLHEGSNLYFVGVGRFAVLVDRQNRGLDMFVEQLVRTLREPVASGSLMIELDARVGILKFKLEAPEIDDSLRKAMTAVHNARTVGVACVAYIPEFDAGHQRAYAILRDIPRALAHNEFHLVFQPKLRVSTRAFEGAEALLRWRHPVLGAISPGEFIPLAENTTLIHDLTTWVIDTALMHLAELHNAGLRVTIAVNVSARTLERPQFLETLKAACAKHGVAREMLHIECTEYSGLTAPATLESLKQIRALGMQLSLDDFGTGYSNLTCLETLPFQMLKVDRALVAHVTENPRARQLLQGIVNLGHGMGFRMLAEGVESEEVFHEIVALGFDHIQGYYLSRPLAPAALKEFLRAPPELPRKEVLIHKRSASRDRGCAPGRDCV
ncbi:putative bifunctional diguanylate cyclase/phosphodiesterase [Variovorax sp. N23]|uniref:putative bifunctional diguanylate cyclase/phosphodiesterase n=1 Tax=Variovorax sp. N23 TaxID=2980555 RepID=UPI0021C937C1|nr:GGDEF domain-containing phosphodiesterase [Variovorax sp. N23]MCU4119098.1 EAL domain-containing protein [Variovorax sp. N23]